MIRVYRMFRANRDTLHFKRGRFFGPKPDGSNIVLGKKLYKIDPNKVAHEVKRGFFGNQRDTVVQYYREGNPTPMDPMDFAATPGADAGMLKTVRDAGFIGNLFRQEWDFTRLLLICSVLGNMVLGGVIYSVVK